MYILLTEILYELMPRQLLLFFFISKSPYITSVFLIIMKPATNNVYWPEFISIHLILVNTILNYNNIFQINSGQL